tara:strand:- start:416 stop:973 length:558 start_codon:yes stop_codon:yes gene_type:complete
MKLFRKRKKRTRLDKFVNTLIIFVFILLILPQSFVLPVEGMKKNDYNQNSYWHYPWGKSGTHKGVDIFGRKGTNVVSSVRGFTFATGNGKRSGKYVIILGPKLRFHYFAHLNSIETKVGEWNSLGEKIGTLGNSGNAKGKPDHLHYSIISWLPHFWNIDNEPQGYRKMFYLNPIDYLNDCYNIPK